VAIKVDPQIMDELLQQPGVSENVAQMTPEMLEWFKKLLVSQGVYAKFVYEKNKENLNNVVVSIDFRKET
jgi:hypothetical protein